MSGSPRMRPPARGALSQQDIALVNALAAYQLRYGQAEEAMVLAQLAHRYQHGHSGTLMLMARALAALQDWSSASILADAARNASPGRALGRAEMLFCAVVAFSSAKLDVARRLLAKAPLAGIRSGDAK